MMQNTYTEGHEGEITYMDGPERDALDFECRECEAPKGSPCIVWWYGREFPTDTHEERGMYPEE
jgi:hypothetical protein